MTLSVGNVTFDSDDPEALAQFWAAVFQVEAPEPQNPFMAEFSLAGGPNLMFIKVPEAKTVKNRVHVDLAAADRPGVQTEVDRLEALGAKVIRQPKEEFDTYWSTLQDPEGNEFCIGAP